MLIVYAVCAPFLVWMRHVRPRRLLVAGSGLVLWSAALATIVQTRVPSDGAGLGDYWLTDGSPMSNPVGYFLIDDFFTRVGLITLWNRRPTTSAHIRVRAAGRMALTNYLKQTLLGIVVLRSFSNPDSLGRTDILAFVVIVWAVQLAWSKPWLDRFRFGPAEWLWRRATYRRNEPFRLSTSTGQSQQLGAGE